MSKVKMVEEAIELQTQVKQAEARLKEIKDALAADLEPGRSYPIAGVDVQVKKGQRRFDAKKFMEKYPTDQRANLKFYTRAVDQAEVKKRFSDIELDQFHNYGAPSVVIPARKEG